MREKALKIIPYEPNHRETWENFVATSNNGTLYHTQKFLGYHPPKRFHDFHHLISVDDKIRCVIPGAITESEVGKTYVSYPGSSFGGFVVPRVSA